MNTTKLEHWFTQHLDSYRSDPQLGDQWRTYLFEDGYGECGGDWNSDAQKDEAIEIMERVIRTSAG